jgi:hypothetical protein
MRPCTGQEFETLPHIILTSELEWDPSVLDHVFKEDEQWGEAPTFNSQFDEDSNYKQRIILHHKTYFERQDGTTTDDIIDQCIYATLCPLPLQNTRASSFMIHSKQSF